MTYCILCVLHKCRVPWYAVCPKFCAVQQICLTNLPQLPSHYSSSTLNVVFLNNGVCLNFNKKPFATQAVYTQHIDRNTVCYNFIVRKLHVAAPHGASVSRHWCLHEDGLVKWTNNKRPSCLRHHVVIDVPIIGDLAVGDDYSVLGDDPKEIWSPIILFKFYVYY